MELILQFKQTLLWTGLIRTKLYDTTLTSIALSVFVTNLLRFRHEYILFDLDFGTDRIHLLILGANCLISRYYLQFLWIEFGSTRTFYFYGGCNYGGDGYSFESDYGTEDALSPVSGGYGQWTRFAVRIEELKELLKAYRSGEIENFVIAFQTVKNRRKNNYFDDFLFDTVLFITLLFENFLDSV